ncbi:anaerobic sulfatase maturase [Photobacterium rosenbergii]|uniref:Anaerobic sulfatase maturase n=1 Tax=Photobacterium rosenbergii TaxID=294936 RepID=A0ABU3ZN95_9GAMM|nr:anaerobic sulfatase maturase [Photobacterium rosenbergii]MDV5171599.1 anaerobic sulfatase maturase [Photobacterium rosenbergii]
MSNAKSFQIVSKPTGSACNIDCKYCFYLEKEKLYPNRNNNWKMPKEVLESYVRSNIEGSHGDVVEFIWQGGEPTLAGLDFFEEAIRLQHLYAKGKRISNSFQTNGMKIDKKWARFLKDNNFLVGISIDGSQVHHDKLRQTKSGKSTYSKVVEAIKLFNEVGVEYNTLTVVSKYNVDEAENVYNALKAVGSRFMQFTPLVERIAAQPDSSGLYLIKPDFIGESAVAEWSVPSKPYGQFMNKIFDLWAKEDIGKYFVMNFEQTMTQLVGGQGSCVFAEECGANLALEANGDVYSCDHFVYPDNKLGNIIETGISELAFSDQQAAFSKLKTENISMDCANCAVRPVCNAGCPKHRFATSSNGMPNKNYLCDGYKSHFEHVLHRMKYILNKMYNIK